MHSPLYVALEGNADLRRLMGEALEEYAQPIMDELRIIGALLSPTERKQHALCFALASPQAGFDKNAAVTPALVRAVNNGASWAELAATIASGDLGLHRNKARYIEAASDFIRAPLHMAWHSLLQLLGFGPKVASMAMALADEHAPVYTLDRHMIRAFDMIAGNEPRIHVGRKEYRETQTLLVAQHEQWFPDMPVFVNQWAVWNLIRGFHACHLPIFGIEL